MLPPSALVLLFWVLVSSLPLVARRRLTLKQQQKSINDGVRLVACSLPYSFPKQYNYVVPDTPMP
jgi:hypothetical protein